MNLYCLGYISEHPPYCNTYLNAVSFACKHMDATLVLTLLRSLLSSSPTPSSLITSLQMGGFVCHGGKQPAPGWLLVSPCPRGLLRTTR